VTYGIGSRINGLRNELGLSRTEFGNKLDLTGEQVRRIEVEERKPTEETYIGLNREFGASLDVIFTGKAWISVENMNMNLHTITAKKAINDLNQVAKAVRQLDEKAKVGIDFLEKELRELAIDPQVEKNILSVREDSQLKLVNQ